MDSPDVPGQRARLSELNVAFCALKGLQFDMSLVVQDQGCALRESLLAGNAVWVDEPALEHRLLGVSIALDRHLDLSVGVDW